MALFGKKKVSPEEQAAREANKAKLDSFKRIMDKPIGEKKGLLDMVKQDLKDEYNADKYIKAISNMTVHVKRAKRIREITMGK